MLSDADRAKIAKAFAEVVSGARKAGGRFLDARLRVTSIPMVYGAKLQKPAEENQIFQLHLQSDRYFFTAALPGCMAPPPNGKFIFAILFRDPSRMYCGIPFQLARGDEYAGVGNDGGIVGHSSLTGGKDVLYAGEILLEHGRLVEWTNGSGHYKPLASLRSLNFLPMIRRMLPASLFTGWEGAAPGVRRILTMVDGYVV
jgi:hypothetical protein